MIYLDYNASTPLDPLVARAMMPFLEDHFGNPTSGHWAAAGAHAAIADARKQIAALLDCSESEIVFTSGGSEANNLALKGLFSSLSARDNHIITTSVEHPAVVEPCRYLERLGAQVTYLPVDGTGRVDPDDLQRAITARTILISIIHANNEVGTIQPLEACARIAHDHGIAIHSDGAQCVGKVETSVRKLGVDLYSIVAHKFYGPKGVGALYVRNGLKLEPLIHGGEQQGGQRAGTESALLAVGLGKACELAQDLSTAERARGLRDLFWQQLQAAFGSGVVLNGHERHRLPNTLNVSFIGHRGSEILARLNGVAASTGSACHAGTVGMSPTLKAMGVSVEAAAGAVRFSLGRWTTREEIETVLGQLLGVVERVDAS